MDYCAESKVSPLFGEVCFTCGSCQRVLGLTHEHVDRLLSSGPLRCIICNCPLMLRALDIVRISDIVKRQELVGKWVLFFGAIWFSSALLILFIFNKLLALLMAALGFFILFILNKTLDAPPNLHVKLERFRPEVKRRYRRLWRMES